MRLISTAFQQALTELGRIARYQGISISDADNARLSACVRHRMRSIGTNDAGHYLRALRASEHERQAALEEMLVRESWFFRDTQPFENLPDVLDRSGSMRDGLRILSLACASGEEPYSISIALLEAGYSTDQFTVDAVDLSDRGLANAAKAQYSERALRELPAPLVTRYFERLEDGGYRLQNPVRSTVHYTRANINRLPAVMKRARYNAIFVRNVMIYLSEDFRRSLLESIQNLLCSNGVLVVGHAEAGLLSPETFVPAGPPGSFTFTRRKRTGEGDARTIRAAIPGAASTPTRALAGRYASDGASSARSNTILHQDLLSVVRLADRGAYAEAERRLRVLVQAWPLAETVHYYLGLVCAAQNRKMEACEHFRRALYLDPDHSDSRQHLSLLQGSQARESAWTRQLDGSELSPGKAL